ncbi:receptor-like protein 9DC3 isoform X1 [Capsicum annuum]|uniref:receptor-like protein 9DC3 isoform X1 n=1 Tax=Capsicum annuum TaxID=4072 RepID=UPI001FB10AEB|nr:receptor-like protein 9DC3 isoform X1 [Capsicum annuum]
MGYGRLLFLLLASFFLCRLVFSSSEICRRDQSLALVEFNQSFVVDASSASFLCDEQSYPKTSSWNMNEDCCSWEGVICDETSGHVIELDLSCSQLVGEIDSNSSVFRLSHLQRLNLSMNDFYGSHISPQFGRFSSLTHLNLSNSNFSGQIPSEISHLSKLQSLFLSDNSELGLAAYDFKMLLQNLTQLRELHLSGVSISSTIPLNFSSHLTTMRLRGTRLYGLIPERIFNLPNLETLDLSYNDKLNGYFPKNKWNSSASLKELDLVGVNFSGNYLPESIGYITSLQRLVLSSCNLSGPIPKSLWNLIRLEYMDLQDNHLEGPIFPRFTGGLQNLSTLMLSNNSLNGAIPSWIFSLPLLSHLDLSNNHFSGQLKDFRYNSVLVIIDVSENQLQGFLPKSIQNLNSVVSINLALNQLQGPLPKSFQKLLNLTYLDLSYNNFNDSIDVSVFSDLKQLWYLDLSFNSISLTNENKVKSTVPESLEYLYLSGCEVNELDFLRSANQLQTLDLSNNKIRGRIPDWLLSNWMHSISNLNLSHNMLTSIDLIRLPPLTIDLRSNFLRGMLPIPPTSVEYFFISNNSLTGEIPSSICNLTSLKVLDLARNNLKGAIPQCLGNMSDQLEVLDMQHNSLSGNLRTAFSSGSQLRSFNLHDNKLEGKIPRSLANCKELEVLDLGNNHLSDTFPMWLGTLPNLQVLSLRSNNLHGPIRTSRSLKLFPQLRMLDLSSNAFTAELPTSLFRSLKAMRRIDQTIKAPGDDAQAYYRDSVTVVTKGLELKVVRILSLYTTMDLSSNKFEGHIGSMMGDLIALRVLNLSHNGLQGHMPPSLGKLSVVESLDLSSNNLSGEIPKQLASLTSLAVLNLSRNHLEGCIPKGPQFATFGKNSYEGNDGLQGFPVSGGCGINLIPEKNNTTFEPDEESDSTFLSELSWEVVLMGYGSGLIIGFSIAYVMLSSRKPNWLSRIYEDLEYRISMRSRKKQQCHTSQMHYRRRVRRRRRNNGI